MGVGGVIAHGLIFQMASTSKCIRSCCTPGWGRRTDPIPRHRATSDHMAQVCADTHPADPQHTGGASRTRQDRKVLVRHEARCRIAGSAGGNLKGGSWSDGLPGSERSTGDKSMPGNQRSGPGVRDDALRGPAKHRSSVSKMARKFKAKTDTPHGLRTCLASSLRPRRPPLVARFAGIPLKRPKTAVLTDREPDPVLPGQGVDQATTCQSV